MKSAGRKIISLLLCTMLLLGTVAVGGIFVSADDVTYSTGDTLYYGTYPQSDVTSSLGSVLDSQSGTWQSYNYYSGSGSSPGSSLDGQMTASNYMRYKDVTYNGNKYRGVTFDGYRPPWTGCTQIESESYQDDNGYTTGNVYWFKYEPLKWRVLDPSTGLVMCETIIDSQPYNNYIISNGTDGHGNGAGWGNSAQTYYASDWANSSLRAWLNNDFYNTAFSDEQKSNILTTTNSNKSVYTFLGILGVSGYEEYEEYEEYDSAETQDKVFLLSCDEVTNSAYGFDWDPTNYDTAKSLQGSDYAKCQGLYVYIKSGSELDGTSGWWLRSPGIDSIGACSVNYGSAPCDDFVGSTDVGVCPALKIQIGNDNIYNLGEETYSFKNYGDSDSKGGHCFGMSMTSAGYYTGELSKSVIDLSEDQALYSMSASEKVKKPICFYQGAQGECSKYSIVAGGNYYLELKYNISQDWNSVINYVKDHSYDGKGSLQIGFRKDGEGGHAINFLRYEEVDGQQRIYAYDNNFPTIETYFYQDSNGNVYQAPKKTFSGAIDCIALRSVTQFFKNVVSYEKNNYIYAAKDSITVSGAEVYPIETSDYPGEYVLFEIPDNTESVEIKPNESNAEFTYMDETYSFGAINSNTYGELVLSQSDDSTEMINFEIKNAPSNPASTARIFAKSDSVNKYSNVTIKATATGIPTGYVLAIYEGGSFRTSGTKDEVTLYVGEVTGGKNFTVKVIDEKTKEVQKDANGNELAAEIRVEVKSGFFNNLIGFFKRLFGSNGVTIQP